LFLNGGQEKKGLKTQRFVHSLDDWALCGQLLVIHVLYSTLSIALRYT
jgi:hypothetical protein